MDEHLRRFRRREATSNQNVWAYRFIERAAEISDDSENGDWSNKMLEFAGIDEQMRLLREQKEEIPLELIERRKALQAQLDPYLAKRFKEYQKSVLTHSKNISRRPHESGKDSYVYFHGTIQQFHARPDVPRYVQKYSVPSREVGPDNVEYLQKKYRLLRKLLSDHIPRAWFVLGEFRHGIPKHELGEFHTTLRAITIQREIRGKTFAEMTDAERHRPEVQAALKRAVNQYLKARDLLRNACKQVGVDHRTFELSLDLGEASPDSETGFRPLSYASPNAMYDERKNEVFFIDMGWGAWNPDREKVYQYLMKG